MLSRRTAVVALALVLATPAYAHGPTPQKVDQSVMVKADPAKVWALVKDFGAIQSWHPGVEKSSATGAAAGAERTLALKGKPGEIVEGLDEVDEAKKSISYRLSGEAGETLPVSSYSAAMVVTPKDGGAEVKWEGRFYRADTSNEPPEGKDDPSAVSAMTEFFKTGLEGLKAKAEAGG